MSSTPLAGRGALVTGGGRGIGAAVARALADAGAAVVVASRTPNQIERVADELLRRGAKAWAIACDVSDEASVARLGAEAMPRHLEPGDRVDLHYLVGVVTSITKSSG